MPFPLSQKAFGQISPAPSATRMCATSSSTMPRITKVLSLHSRDCTAPTLRLLCFLVRSTRRGLLTQTCPENNKKVLKMVKVEKLAKEAKVGNKKKGEPQFQLPPPTIPLPEPLVGPSRRVFRNGTQFTTLGHPVLLSSCLSSPFCYLLIK